MYPTTRFALALIVFPSLLTAQKPLAERLRGAGTRTIAFSAKARPDACGDGSTSYSDGLSGPRTRYYDGLLLTHAPWDTHLAPCEPGLMRVSVRMVEGSPSWLRLAVGPLPVLGDTVLDLGLVSTREAGEFLQSVARGGEGRAAVDALMPLVVLDSFPRWDLLAVAARDSTRMQRYRRRASDLMARAASGTLPGESVDDDAAGLRREAVYALARKQERNEDPVPQLLDIAKTNPHRDVRVAALYSLGQTGDARAIDLFASMLRGR
ncbi:MAG: hypothetical protein JWL61_93 [Gemmatimonadetes bacterium]|nr:hypothetical protein [Gemmatimonadota bacterium]